MFLTSLTALALVLAQVPCDPASIDTLDTLRRDLSPRGHEVYDRFIDSLEPGDSYYDEDGFRIITNRDKLVDLLLEMPMNDWAPALHEASSRGLRKLGVHLSEDAAVSDIDNEIVDELDERFERAVGETRANAIRLAVGLAYAMEYGGRVRLWQHRMQSSRLRLDYTYDPDGDDFPGLRYDYTARTGLRLNLDVAPDDVSLGLSRTFDWNGSKVDTTFTATHSDGDSEVRLWFRIPLR